VRHDQRENSRFGDIAAAISTAGESVLAFSERFSRTQAQNFANLGTMGLRGRWSAASTAVGALSLGMATIAVGSLLLPQAESNRTLVTQQANVRVVASLPPLAAAAPEASDALPATQSVASVEAESSLFSNPFAALEEVVDPAPSAPFTFEAAYTYVTEDIRRTVSETVSVGRGDTLMALLTDAGALRLDAYNAIAAMKPLYDPRKLRAGQELELSFDELVRDNDEGEAEIIRLLTAVTMKTDVDREVAVRRSADGEYSGLELIAELETGNVRARGTINSSLFLAAADAGVPAAITVEMIRMYSYDIDFQREIRQGDTFEVLFTRDYDENGDAVREGDVLYASMNVRGRERRLWRHEPGDGENWDYFDEEGRSMRKFLMKTPIDGARISSNFGNRRHPILGYTRLHAGTDFAAPSGTPIYAAGNGTIEMAQRNGSFGNYVRIRHANGYQTAYAHMRGYGRGIRKGVRVTQGQVIGYVGTTGRSTGPHLHYEVIHNGNKVNPQRIRVPTGRTLTGDTLQGFQEARAAIDTLMAEAPAATQIAEADLENETSAQ
jgi:murein DD-endopeptidase MepM/ murein hydrolase activator NlpD